MNKQQMIDKLSDKGIHQLNCGESVGDALDYIDGKLPQRKGYRIKSDSGRPLDRNEIIATSNKEAFAKSVRTPEWIGYNHSDPTVLPKEDQRQDETKPGIIQECMYCGVPILTDDKDFDILNCESCMSYAILKNCM